MHFFSPFLFLVLFWDWVALSDIWTLLPTSLPVLTLSWRTDQTTIFILSPSLKEVQFIQHQQTSLLWISNKLSPRSTEILIINSSTSVSLSSLSREEHFSVAFKTMKEKKNLSFETVWKIISLFNSLWQSPCFHKSVSGSLSACSLQSLCCLHLVLHRNVVNMLVQNVQKIRGKSFFIHISPWHLLQQTSENTILDWTMVLMRGCWASRVPRRSERILCISKYIKYLIELLFHSKWINCWSSWTELSCSFKGDSYFVCLNHFLFDSLKERDDTSWSWSFHHLGEY